MAVSMDIKLSDFLEQVFKGSGGVAHEIAHRALQLEHQGWKFTFQMFLISANYHKDGHSISLPENMPTLIPAMMAGKCVGAQLQVFRNTFEKFISTVEEAHAGILNKALGVAEKAGSSKNPSPPDEVKAKFVKKIAQGSKVDPEDTAKVTPATEAPAAAAPEKTAATPVSQAPAQAKPNTEKSKLPEGVCKLRDAKVVGQMVHGTSEGSVYRTVAVGPVNVAIRVVPDGVSIRVEGGFTGALTKRLSEMGFSNKKEYMSMHVACGASMPPSRVVGAVLLGLDTQFTDVITSGVDVK